MYNTKVTRENQFRKYEVNRNSYFAPGYPIIDVHRQYHSMPNVYSLVVRLTTCC